MACGPENVDMSQKIQLSNGRELDVGSFAGLGDLCHGTGKHFSSAPIRVDGMAIGTFCIVDRHQREDVDLDKLQKIADRAAELFKEKHKAEKDLRQNQVAPAVTSVSSVESRFVAWG